MSCDTACSAVRRPVVLRLRSQPVQAGHSFDCEIKTTRIRCEWVLWNAFTASQHTRCRVTEPPFRTMPTYPTHKLCLKVIGFCVLGLLFQLTYLTFFLRLLSLLTTLHSGHPVLPPTPLTSPPSPLTLHSPTSPTCPPFPGTWAYARNAARIKGKTTGFED